MIAVVRTGTANLASVLAALRRAGAEPALCDDPEVVRRAERVVLPGVGAFGAARDELRQRGLDEALIDRFQQHKPLLAICLGLQLFASRSEETPGVAGLGLLPDAVTRFPRSPALRVPHMGWNEVLPTPGARYVRRGHAWFANSYKLDHIPAGWEGSVATHGGPFVASLEQGDIVACQFHPELSGEWGLDLLRRWLEGA